MTVRVENWNPNVADQSFEDVCINRLTEAAEVAKSAIEARCPVGTVTRPMYQSGPYAGSPWTSRDGGRLKQSVRVTKKLTKTGRLSKKRNVRIYAGSELAYYASIVEHSRPFMRPGFESAMGQIKEIIGVK